ncbi:MAG: PAS domain S-box protein [Fibrobacterales bacterium]
MTQKRNILLIDDQGEIIELMMNILNEYYTCKVANTGKKALEILSKTSDIALILLDVNMPEMDGYEVCRRIKAETRLKDIPIIFITGYTDGEKIVKGFEVGGQDYITKPFNPNELLARVNTHMVINKDLLQRVERSEERYRTIFLSSSAIVLVDLTGLIIDANPGFVKIFEYESARDLIGKSVHDLKPKNECEVSRKKMNQIVNVGIETTHFEMRYLTRTGRVIYGNVATTRCLERDDGEDFFISVFSDVTEQHHMQEQLKLSEEMFRTVADYTYDWEYWIDPDGVFKYVAPSVERITGYTPDWFLGEGYQKLLEIIHPDDRDELLRHINEDVNELGCRYEYDFRIITHRGDVRWIAHACLPIISDNKYLGHRASNRDVTENKQLSLKIEESQRRLKDIADNIEEIFWLVSIEGTVKMVNSAFGEVFKSDESILGKNFWELPIWNENECLEVKQKIKEMLDENILHFSIETNWHMKSGIPRICRNNISLVPDDTGGVGNFAIITQDITRYKKFAEKERIQQEQLRQADKMTSLGVLVAGIAHEINNPNNLIMLNSAFLKKVWWDIIPVLEREVTRNPDFRLSNLKFETVKDKFYQLMNSISMGSDRIKNIVHSLKDFVRVDTGLLDNNISINNVVKDAVTIVQNAIRKVTDSFTVEYEENIPMVKGNPQQLEQVIVNLLTNSCQALASAEKAIMIRTSYVDGEVMVTVYDEGEGMNEDVMKQMKDPFFTTKRDQGGTGLGLSVSHGIMEAHSGRLEYKSIPGIGTEAHIIIPVAQTGGDESKLSEESGDAVQ